MTTKLPKVALNPIAFDRVFALNKHRQEVIPFPLAIVDATMYELMEVLNTCEQVITKIFPDLELAPEKVTSQSIRSALTTGSVEYTFRQPQCPVGTIRIQVLSAENTLMRILPAPAIDPNVADENNILLQAIIDTIQKKVAHDAQISSKGNNTQQVTDVDTIVSDFVEAVKKIDRRGRPGDIGKWVREQLKTRNKEEVFEEYLIKQKIDIENSRGRKAAMNAFNGHVNYIPREKVQKNSF